MRVKKVRIHGNRDGINISKSGQITLIRGGEIRWSQESLKAGPVMAGDTDKVRHSLRVD